MKRSLIRRTLSLILAVTLVCSLSIAAFAATGTENWTGSDGTSYAAVVTRNTSTTSRSIAITSSTVELNKHGTHTFGGCYYKVSFSNTLWTSYVSRLNAAGEKVAVRSSYSSNIYFRDTYTFTATNYAGSFCATTTGYGYTGSYYVQKLADTPVTLLSGSFTFAPSGCANVITTVIDASLV